LNNIIKRIGNKKPNITGKHIEILYLLESVPVFFKFITGHVSFKIDLFGEINHIKPMPDLWVVNNETLDIIGKF
jgi:hypothetical protein